MVLKLFLNNVAQAFRETGNPIAENISEMILQLEIGPNIHSNAQLTTPLSLKQALSAPDCHVAAGQLNFIADKLPWTSAKEFRVAPKSFRGNYHFVPIVGPKDLILSDQFRTGIFLQDADTYYPSHMHEAEELYLPLSGTALWQKDNNEFSATKSGQLIHHLPYQPHATWTKDAPMLAVWAWVGNLSPDTYSYL